MNAAIFSFVLFLVFCGTQARTVEIVEKTSRLIWESENTDLHGKDWASILASQTNVKDGNCTKGRCEICIEASGQKGCLIATAKTGSMHLQLTLNGVVDVEGDITGSSPQPICVSSVPSQPMIEKLCIVPKDFDVTKQYACVDIYVEVQGHHQSMPIGCFTIPSEVTIVTSTEYIDVVETLIRELDADSIKEDLHGKDWVSILAPQTNIKDGNCTKGRCEICMEAQGEKGCLIATAKTGSMHLQLTLNGVVDVEGDITGSSPQPICVSSVPSQPMIEKLCIVPKNFDVTKQSACVDIYVEVQGYKQSIPIGCFTIPSEVTIVTSTEYIDVVGTLIRELDADSIKDKVEEQAGMPTGVDITNLATCEKGKCKLCRTVHGKTGCVIATAGKGSIHLKFTVSGYTLIKGDITSDSQGPICITHVPTQPNISEMCIVPDKISLQKMSACIGVSVTFNGTKHSESLGCFTIPQESSLEPSSTPWSMLFKYIGTHTN